MALAWVLGRPGVGSVLIGASRAEQLAANIASLKVVMTDEQRRLLDEASAPILTYPTTLFSPTLQRFVFGGHEVGSWR